MLKDAVRRKFDVVMVWAVDRLGRSLVDLIASMQELHGAKDVGGWRWAVFCIAGPNGFVTAAECPLGRRRRITPPLLAALKNF
jgi:hypothetical protein